MQTATPDLMVWELVQNESAVRQPNKHLCRAVQPHPVGQRLDVGLYEIDAERFELLAQGRFALSSQLADPPQRRSDFGTAEAVATMLTQSPSASASEKSRFPLVAALQHMTNGNQLC